MLILTDFMQQYCSIEKLGKKILSKHGLKNGLTFQLRV